MSAVNEITAAAGATQADDLELKHEKLRNATRKMEGYFVGMLLKQMHLAAEKGGLFGDDSASATYRDMFDDAVGDQIGSRGSFGIADMLYKELVVQIGGANCGAEPVRPASEKAK